MAMSETSDNNDSENGAGSDSSNVPIPNGELQEEAEKLGFTLEELLKAFEQFKAGQLAAQRYADCNDSDVILYNSTIFTRFAHQDRRLFDIIMGKGNKGKNVLLILVTLGGDPHVAYRCARLLQDNYKEFSIFIPSLCKSAGTLLAIGAHKVIMAPFGELGPIDLQVPQKDEWQEIKSSAVFLATFDVLEEKCYQTFRKYMLKIIRESPGRVTLRTSMDVAAPLAADLYKPILAQIDPSYVGEMHRNMSIAFEYGKRLAQIGKNIDEKEVRKLVYQYPEHKFLIDGREAKTLFKRVKEPDELLEKLQFVLGKRASIPNLDRNFLSGGIECLARPLGSPSIDEEEQESRAE